MLILNVTRTDLAKNRQGINWLIGTIQGLGSELGNIMEVMEAQLGWLRMFIKEYLQLLALNNRLCQFLQ